jgi:ubiquinone/menaquinone biosynthesis C-methylase UbiE
LLDPDIQSHYDLDLESARLAEDDLELTRSRELLRRYLPAPPCRVLDVGGGPGKYAAWLTQLGYTVHLVDPIARHVAEALDLGGFTASVGDARSLDAPDASCDAVLLMGPLYHLVSRTDRHLALREARRVVRPGGVVLAVGISRFASLLDGLRQGWLTDPQFRAIALQDVASGQHRNPAPEEHPNWFTTAYLHQPADLGAEVVEAGLALEGVFAIEGPGWLLPNAPSSVAQDVARLVEREPSLLGASAHLMAIARRSPS